MCLFGGGGCIKYEGRIIKNVNWLLHKNQLCMFSSLYPPTFRGSTYQHEEGGGGEGGIRIKTT